MINAEKFKDELLEILSENRYIEVDKSNRKIRKCTGNNCPKCMFGITALGKGRDSCSIAAMLWLLSEYRESVKLSRLEYGILEHLLNNTEYVYMTREKSGALFVYDDKPSKTEYYWNSSNTSDARDFEYFNDLFQFVQWEDEKPTSIKDVLENCEVVEDESNEWLIEKLVKGDVL